MTYRITEATAMLSTSALQNNFLRITRAAGVAPENAFALIKANAYGHGAREVASRLRAVGARRFAVARLSEAIEVREVIHDCEIMILAPTDPTLVPDLLAGDFTQVVNCKEYADELSALVPRGKGLKIAFAVDCGRPGRGDPFGRPKRPFSSKVDLYPYPRRRRSRGFCRKIGRNLPRPIG